MLLSSFWKPFYPRGRSFLWKVSDADIAHVKLQESPPGALMCPPLRVLRWCQRGASCCPRSGEPVSSWVMTPSSGRLFLMLQNTHRDNGAHVGHTSSRHKHTHIRVILNKQAEDETPASRLLRFRGTSRDGCTQAEQTVTYCFSSVGQVLWRLHIHTTCFVNLERIFDISHKHSWEQVGKNENLRMNLKMGFDAYNLFWE